MPLPDFTEADVLRWFGPYELKKAQPYLHAVTRLETTTDFISAHVLGTAAKPYMVEIEFELDMAGSLSISPYCTCPVGWHCKHTAATLLAYLARQKQAEKLNPEVLAWLEDFRRTQTKTGAPKKPPGKREKLFYCLVPQSLQGLRVRFIKARVDDNGQMLKGEEWNNVERALTNPPGFINDKDMTILPLLWAMRDKHAYVASFPLVGDKGETALQRMLASGRALYGEKDLVMLRAGGIRSAQLQWQTDAHQRTRASLVANPPASQVLSLKQLWYVDGESAEIGVLESPHPAGQIARLLDLPPLSARDLPVVASALAELAPALPRPLDAAKLRCIDAPPVPQLTLGTADAFGMSNYRNYPYAYKKILFDYATLHFRYDEFSFAPGDKNAFVTAKSGETVCVKRNLQREAG